MKKSRVDEFERRLGVRKERSLFELIKNKESCFFCQKLILLFQNWTAQKYGNLPFSKLGRITVEILPHWLPTIEKDENGHPQGQLLRLGAEFMLWDFIPDGDDGGNHSPNFVFQRYNKPSLSVTDFCDGSRTAEWLAEKVCAYSGRARPLLADLRIFKKWKNLCKSQHGRDCEASSVAQCLDRIRLIDVEKRCLVDDAHGQDYVALSYV